jgi:hypothetical protein
MEGYKIYTVRHYLEERPIKSFVILRHDVDRFPRNALRMAMVEAEKGVSSTYYFRVGHDLNLGIIREVCRFGHEVGYHYEVLSKTNGDQVRAKGLFRKELELLRSACEIKTISRHGQPLSRFDNGTLWNGSSFKPYGVLGDAGLSIIGVPYYTDAGRSWDGRNSLRDRPREPCGVIVRDTFELIEMLRSRFHEGVYLNIHPERWVRNVPEWCVSYSIDLCFNIGKRVVNSTRD